MDDFFMQLMLVLFNKDTRLTRFLFALIGIFSLPAFVFGIATLVSAFLTCGPSGKDTELTKILFVASMISAGIVFSSTALLYVTMYINIVTDIFKGIRKPSRR
jgi:hypothetical protein